MSKLKKISKIKILLLGILILAFIFRFYRLFDWFSFGMDQEYEAFLVKNIVTGRHFPLIGVNAADTGLYLGPFFIYLAVIPYLLFQGNPLGFAFFSSALGVATTLVIFLAVRVMFNRRAALLASFFYAVSFLASFYDRQFWNPTLVPLVSILIGYFLFLSITQQKKYLLAAVLVFGLGIQSHLSVWILLPLFVFLIIKYRQTYGKIIIVQAVVLFLILQLPVFIFELKHNFTNLRAFTALLAGGIPGINPSTLSGRWTLFLNTLGRFFWIPPRPDLFLETGQCRELAVFRKNAYPEITVLSMSCISLFIFIYKQKLKSFFKNKFHPSNILAYGLVLGVFLLTVLAVTVYPRVFSEYYLLLLFPYLAIIFGLTADYLLGHEEWIYLSVTACFLFLMLNLITLFTAYSSYSFKNKLAVLKYSKIYVGERYYSLEALGECPRFAGWRYLYEHFVGKPVHSYMDSYYDWLYYDRKIGPVDRVVLLSMIDRRIPEDLLAKWQEAKLRFLTEYKIQAEKTLENIQVYILSPKK